MKLTPTENELNTLHCGCFDGLRGLEIEMTLDDALSASHQGQCDNDVAALAMQPAISAQLDAIHPDTLRLALQECGAGWDLSDDDANRQRAVWMAACDIRERFNQGELSDQE